MIPQADNREWRIIQQAAAVSAGPATGQVPDTAPAIAGQPPAPSPEESFAGQVQALQNVRFQELREEGQQAQRQAMELWRVGDTEAALDALQQYLGRLALQAGGGQMELDRVAMLRQPIENRLKQLKTLKAQQAFEHEQKGGKDALAHSKSTIEMEHQARMKQVSELMKKFNSLYESAKYDDAELAALQAKELDRRRPDGADAPERVRVRGPQDAQVGDIHQRFE